MPGKIELLMGPNLSYLTEKFLSENPEISESSGECMYLVNNRSRAALLKNRFLLQNSGSAAPDFPFQTSSAFLQKMFDKLNAVAAPPDFDQRALMLFHIIEDNKDRLVYFKYGDRAFPAALVESLQQFFDDVRFNESDHLLDAGISETVPVSSRERIHSDLSLLFQRYQETLENRYPDPASLLRQIIHAISPEFLKRHFPRLRWIIWEDVTFFKNLHIQLIERLRKLGMHHTLIFFYGENREIFSEKDSLVTKLRQISDRIQAYSDNDGLSESLFKMENTGIRLPAKISVAPAIDRLKEVESLAGEIKKLVVDKNWRFGDIAVSSPQLESYLSLVQTVFNRYRIPFTLLGGKLLEQSFLIQHLVLPLKLVSENYPVVLLDKMLRSPYFNYREKLADIPYKKYLSLIRVRAGRSQILEQIRKAEKFYTKDPEKDDPDVLLTQGFHQFQETVTNLFRETEFFEHPHTAGEIYDYLANLFIQRHRLVSNILKEARSDHKKQGEETIAALQHFLEAFQSWKTKRSTLSPDQKYSINELLRVILFITGSVRYQVRRPNEFGVQILALHSLAGRNHRAVFILGMEDGIFPGKFLAEFTQPQTLPEELQTFIPPEPVKRDRETFLRLLQLPADMLQFSYPRFHQDQPILPSLFLRELQRISDSSLENKRDVKLHTSSDILTVLGNTTGNGGGVVLNESVLPEPLHALVTPTLINRFNYLKGVETHRRNLSEISQWEGELGSDHLTGAWLNDYFRNARFSVTWLNTYARCPMVFFFQRILGVEPLEETDEFLTPLERGITVHNILFRFYRHLPFEQQTIENLLKIGEEELEKMPVPRSILWQLEKQFYLGRTQHQGLLPAFWEYEKEMSERYSTTPRHFELSFGRPISEAAEVDPASSEQPFVMTWGGQNYYFKGKIDRVEISEDGALLIVDYKTGNVPNLDTIWNGEELQLPVYLKAVFDLLRKDYPNLEMAGGAYYSLKRSPEIRKKITFLDGRIWIGDIKLSKKQIFPNKNYLKEGTPAHLEEFIEQCFEYTIRYMNAIRVGRFPHTLNDNRCFTGRNRECKFLPLCRLNRFKQSYLKRQADDEKSNEEK